MYSCANKQLSILPAQSGPFTVQALNPNAPFHGWPIEACGRHFVITQHGPCTYCPENVPRDVCPPGNETLLYAGSGLSVYVPGGQQYYIEPNGALGFTQAHSASYPTGSLWGVSAYQEGAFIYLPSDGWIACPDGNDASSWQVFAKLPGLVFASTCRGFNAVVHGRPSGSFGAWQYT
ncbi:hypothetical protein M501DRAFT_999278 [Patellaria atrata CBS 101060]|uniref:Uncharacterized protein n=1 Tax=Patellaria atrata CBS 101060 TaxID=1346257 RepID=A0A9P4VMJ4_9PEZI|nr:hypothetical protein M501DRAFT_999278 [Patellaria atrata CBS 101060]